MTENIPKLLKDLELFSELSERELQDVAALAQTRKVETDTTIFHEGDPSDQIFVVVNGRVKIVTTSSDGKEFILTVLGPGQVFGEMALLESAPRSASSPRASRWRMPRSPPGDCRSATGCRSVPRSMTCTATSTTTLPWSTSATTTPSKRHGSGRP